MEWFISLSPVLQGLTATIFTWSVTALGAALVFFFKNVDRKILNSMLGFGAGVMTAASFWSLLNPAIELCGELGYSQFLLPAIGFFAGGVFIIFADMLMDKYSYGIIPVNNKSLEKNKSYKKSILLVLAVTLHNIPEGLAVGVAFGADQALDVGFGHRVVRQCGNLCRRVVFCTLVCGVTLTELLERAHRFVSRLRARQP